MGSLKDETETLEKVVGAIYDAALDGATWNGALTKCGEFLNCSAAALFSKGPNGANAEVRFDVGFDPYYKKTYLEKYIHLDPGHVGHFFAEIDVPLPRRQLISDKEFHESRFYLEWHQPQGWIDCATSLLDKSDCSIALFGVYRSERDGLLDDQTLQRMRLIAPHVRLAVMIGRIFDFNRGQTETFANVLDGLSAGVFFVTAGGRVTYTNKSARDILSSGEVLFISGNALAAVDQRRTKELSDLIAAASRCDTALNSSGVSIPLIGRSGDNYVAHVLPLTSGHRREASVSYSASAAIFVHKPNRKTVTAPEAITKAYGLTPSELRVFLAIVEMGGAPEAAEALGISVNTVKSHLQRIFSKTGASRQADLAKLLSGFASPFRD